jgi:large subunit ribosomal protein L6
MSRIGKMPVEVPSGVDVQVNGTTVKVKGSKGELVREFSERVSFELSDGVLTVARVDDTRESRALHGLSRALLANMVSGVAEGFAKTLEIHGVGYRAAMKGSSIELQVGFSHPVVVDPPDGITFDVPEPTRIESGASTRSRSARWPPTSQGQASRALQGQGHQVFRREGSPQGRKGR